MQQISIIIITYNRPDDTLALVRNICQLNHREKLLQEVIILNNASTIDYSAVKAFIGQNPGEKLKFLESPENLGVSRGRNYAAGLALGGILFFMDDDILIEDQEILAGLVKAFERPTGTSRVLGVINAKVRYASNREIQVNAFPHKKYAEFKDAPWFLTGYYVGCCHAFRADCWRSAGNYPEDFFYGMEEYDESFRIIEKGYAIGYDASIEIFHKESPQGRSPKAEKLQMMWVNKSVVAWRYLPLPYFITTATAWSLFFFQKSGGNIGRFLRGWWAVLKIPFTKQRQPLNRNSRTYLKEVKARLWF